MAWKKANRELINLLEDSAKEFRCERKFMFGSPTFYVNNNMFAGVYQDTIILRLAEEDRKEIFSRHSEVLPFTPMGTHTMKEYAALPENICRDAGTFKHWLERSFRYASSLPYKEPKRSKKK